MKTTIYNLIILDESGSMSSLTKQTIEGCNETINTIKTAVNQYADSQQHFVSIYAFQSEGNRPSRYIIKNIDAKEVKHITKDDYEPWGATPLDDAVGSTLTDLKATTAGRQNTIGSVTIITDGMENSSRQYSGAQVAKMIQELKELGWNFNFIGANIDVEAVAARMNIDNTLAFSANIQGTREMFRRERSSRMRYYDAIRASDDDPNANFEERMKVASADYFSRSSEPDDMPKCSPDVITRLERNEVFVFGSNLAGHHKGGAARIAMQHFGAIWGQGEGLQGQSYAIPTMQGGVETIAPFVDSFIRFAKKHPELTFLVTRVGCGIAGFTDSQIAPLFADALHVDNILLPKKFINILLNR